MTDTGRGAHRTCICPWWLMYLFDHRLRRLFQPTDPVIKSLVGSGYSCLDIGCGMGYFTIPLAQLVGPTGHVTAVDLQPGMLQGAARRAQREGVVDRISLRLSTDSDWPIPQHYDFILAFWMLHEVPDQKCFLGTLRKILKTTGSFLLVEPRLHVRERQWEESLALAEAVGFRSRAPQSVKFSRAAILR
ncbi:MAG: class I SAM-dependent methyltransferase [Acidobacteriia bacterium]|nr:class I SAM-dependent methyltransferase [Terriglobia bacterium]